MERLSTQSGKAFAVKLIAVIGLTLGAASCAVQGGVPGQVSGGALPPSTPAARLGLAPALPPRAAPARIRGITARVRGSW